MLKYGVFLIEKGQPAPHDTSGLEWENVSWIIGITTEFNKIKNPYLKNHGF